METISAHVGHERGVPHLVRNTGDEVLRFLFVFALDRLDQVTCGFRE